MLKAIIETAAWWIEREYGSVWEFAKQVIKVVVIGLAFYAFMFFGCL